MKEMDRAQFSDLTSKYDQRRKSARMLLTTMKEWSIVDGSHKYFPDAHIKGDELSFTVLGTHLTCTPRPILTEPLDWGLTELPFIHTRGMQQIVACVAYLRARDGSVWSDMVLRRQIAGTTDEDFADAFVKHLIESLLGSPLFKPLLSDGTLPSS